MKLKNMLYPDSEEFRTIRGINIQNGKKKKILLNKRLTDSQKAFIIGKEIAYNYLNITERSHIYSNLSLDSFDQLLNNLRASYFATALMISKEDLLSDLRLFFGKKYFDDNFILSLLQKYNASPEMLMQRITNVLSRYFNINTFFFHRFNSGKGSDIFSLSKEIRLNTKENPGGYNTSEHYCRRWQSVNVIRKLEKKQNKSKKSDQTLAGTQKSVFINSGNEYLTISIAKDSTLMRNTNYSVTLGFLMNEELRQRISFADDPSIPVITVNDTCERCQIMDCKERIAEPTVYENNVRLMKLQDTLNKIIREESR